jgi:broad specificity phosphatase PhoE
MKIYILRHEDRTQDCTFFSPLTELGHNNAKKLIDVLDKCNIDIIFSSPFIRTLQTIYPFSKKNNFNIHIEYGLSEIHHDDIIPKKSVGLVLPEYLANYYNYNCKYNSLIKAFNIKYPETYMDVVKRVKIFLLHIIKNYKDTKYNILLVTHQSLCCAILEIINNSKIYKETIDSHLINNYPKGKLALVFDNNWTYKMLN